MRDSSIGDLSLSMSTKFVVKLKKIILTTLGQLFTYRYYFDLQAKKTCDKPFPLNTCNIADTLHLIATYYIVTKSKST